jgi:DEAD/DEAH box helicase domain-containing protein
MQSFADGYGSHLRIEQHTVNGHPLWRHDDANWSPEVRRAVTELRGQGLSHVTVSDTYVLDRVPIKLFNALLEHVRGSSQSGV